MVTGTMVARVVAWAVVGEAKPQWSLRCRSRRCHLPDAVGMATTTAKVGAEGAQTGQTTVAEIVAGAAAVDAAGVAAAAAAGAEAVVVVVVAAAAAAGAVAAAVVEGGGTLPLAEGVIYVMRNGNAGTPGTGTEEEEEAVGIKGTAAGNCTTTMTIFGTHRPNRCSVMST